MTPKQADKIIKAGKVVTVHNLFYNETFTALFIRRDRWDIYTADNVYDRAELNVVLCKSISPPSTRHDTGEGGLKDED